MHGRRHYPGNTLCTVGQFTPAGTPDHRAAPCTHTLTHVFTPGGIFTSPIQLPVNFWTVEGNQWTQRKAQKHAKLKTDYNHSSGLNQRSWSSDTQDMAHLNAHCRHTSQLYHGWKQELTQHCNLWQIPMVLLYENKSLLCTFYAYSLRRFTFFSYNSIVCCDFFPLIYRLYKKISRQNFPCEENGSTHLSKTQTIFKD